MLKKVLEVKSRIAVSYAKYGTSHILRTAVSNLFKPVFQFHSYMVYAKDTAPSLDKNGLNLTVIKDIIKFRQYVGHELLKINPNELALEKFSKGQWCAIVENTSGEQLFSSWVADGGKLVEANFWIKEDEAYICSGYTIPSRRGQGIFPCALKLIGSYLSQMGIRRLYGLVLPGNRSSINGLEKAGFRCTGSLRYIKFFMCNKLTLKF